VAIIHDRGNVSLRLSHLHVTLEFKTAHYHAVIYQHPQLGRVLTLDGEIQHVEAWAPLYHEPLVHLPAAFIEKPQTAILLGGGSFFAARELLKYRSIKRVLMLDHDLELLDTIARFYGHAAEARNDPRLEVQITDAFRILPHIGERFDLVINDSIDISHVKGPDVFAAMAHLLRPGGVCSDLVYRHIFEDRSLSRTLNLLRSNYNTVVSLVFAAEYPGILHLLTLWGGMRASSVTTYTCRATLESVWVRRSHMNECLKLNSLLGESMSS
jgi:spermidine synthase